jgi:hypothetical protein
MRNISVPHRSHGIESPFVLQVPPAGAADAAGRGGGGWGTGSVGLAIAGIIPAALRAVCLGADGSKGRLAHRFARRGQAAKRGQAPSWLPVYSQQTLCLQNLPY